MDAEQWSDLARALASLDPGRMVPDGVHAALRYPFIGRHHLTSWEGLAHDVQLELIRPGSMPTSTCRG